MWISGECIFQISLIVNLLHQVNQKKDDFTWESVQQQAFEQTKQEIVRSVAPTPARAGQDVRSRVSKVHDAPNEKREIGSV